MVHKKGESQPEEAVVGDHQYRRIPERDTRTRAQAAILRQLRGKPSGARRLKLQVLANTAQKEGCFNYGHPLV